MLLPLLSLRALATRFLWCVATLHACCLACTVPPRNGRPASHRLGLLLPAAQSERNKFPALAQVGSVNALRLRVLTLEYLNAKLASDV